MRIYPASTDERACKRTLDAHHRLNRVRNIDGLVDHRKDGFSPSAVSNNEVTEGAVVIGEFEPLGSRIGPIPDLAERDVRLPGYLPHGRLCMGTIEKPDTPAHDGVVGARHRPGETKSRRDCRARVIWAQRVGLRTKIQFVEVRRRREVYSFGRNFCRRLDDDREVIVVSARPG